MDPDEIVECEIERQRVNMRVQLFREGIREPREAPHMHAHREVLPLYMRDKLSCLASSKKFSLKRPSEDLGAHQDTLVLRLPA